MATLPELESALTNAAEAGDMDAARKLAVVVKRERAARTGNPGIAQEELIPAVIGGGPREVAGTLAPTGGGEASGDPGVGDKLLGGAEAALAVGSGLTTGTLGMIASTLQSMANEILAGDFGTPEGAERIRESAEQVAQALTYSPRTQTGQGIVEGIGEAGGAVGPLPQLQALGGAARTGALRAAGEPIRKVTSEPIQKGFKKLKEKAEEAKDKLAPKEDGAPRPKLDKASARQAEAESLPVPIKLREGEKTRDIHQLKKEEDAAAHAKGGKLREENLERNERLRQNLDAFLDKTGAKAPDVKGVGVSVDKALKSRAERDKNRYRVLYKKAEDSGEMEAPVTLNKLATYLAESAPEAEVANVLKAAQAKAKQLGAVKESPDGILEAAPITLKNAELLRRSITNATNNEPTNIRQSSILKGIIDEGTEGLGGQQYKMARRSRAEFAKNYENLGLTKALLGTKPGTKDRMVALEDVADKAILSPSTSLQSVKELRRILQNEGKLGKQAWKDLQGGVVRQIKENMFEPSARDSAGKRVISPTRLEKEIRQLDKSGKLDFVFGSAGAKELRAFNNVVHNVLTKPPGKVGEAPMGVIKRVLDSTLLSPLRYSLPVATAIRMVRGIVSKRGEDSLVREILRDSKKESPKATKGGNQKKKPEETKSEAT